MPGSGLMHSGGSGSINADALAFVDNNNPTVEGDVRSRLVKAINMRRQQMADPITSRMAQLRIMRDAAGVGMGPEAQLNAYAPDEWKSAAYGTFPSSNTSTGQMRERYAQEQRQYNPTPMPYADGGSVDPEMAGLGAVGAGIAGVAARRFLPRPINAMARPFLRALAKPTLGIEAVSKTPLPEAVSRARFNLGREATASHLMDWPVHEGQGAWMGDNGMEHNPLYMQDMPRTMGRIRDQPDVMRYAGQLGENLEQAATPVSRFVPNLINTPKSANALMLDKISKARLKLLSEALGADTVTAHRPGNKAMVFDPSGQEGIESLASRVKKAMPDAGLRYGRSDPMTDRVLLSREPWGDATYGDVGAQPRSEMYNRIEDRLLADPSRLGNGLGF